MPVGFHPFELIAILVVALLVFGPKKLPEMGSAIGKSIKEFRKSMNELTAPKEETRDEEEFKVPATPAQDPEALRQELEELERQIAEKKAAAAAYEASSHELPSTEAHHADAAYEASSHELHSTEAHHAETHSAETTTAE